MQYSSFGQKFRGDCGILTLMADLGEAASTPGAIMLGGGNPAHIPEVQAAFRERMGRILDSEYDFETMISSYSGPAGVQAAREAFANFFREAYGWPIGPENIALTNGSQSAFFFLFNMFAGQFADGSYKRVLLPLAPEYIGYEDVGLTDDSLFVSRRPTIELLADHLYKYHVDFDGLEIGPEIGAICVSRPTNPTGNVLTEDEIAHLSELAASAGVPLIIDNAYGMPFPGIIFTDARPSWAPHVIMCMSLSKLGLPGGRTGIVVADADIIATLTGMNAVLALAPNSFGPYMALDMLRTREITRLSREVIAPHYREKAGRAVARFRAELAGLPFHIHKPEGAIFLWLWFEDLPISSQTLYERLKARNVVVVPGHYFFPGLDNDSWRHTQECIRVNYAGDPDTVDQGIRIIAEEVKRAWAGAGAQA